MASHNFFLPGLSNIRLRYDSVTKEYGIQARLENRTGATSVKGTIVGADGSVDKAVNIEPANGPSTMAIVYQGGIANGDPMWVWLPGPTMCQVLLQDGTASTRDNWAKVSDTVAGRADITNVNPPGGTITALEDHFTEIGHGAESKSSGTDVLSLIYFHVN